MNSSNHLTIAHTAIRRDTQGRYCLNDLHKASGGLKNHLPSRWLRNQQTIDLIDELSRTQIWVLEPNQLVNVINGGDQQGVYVVKELVYAYAMWISPLFHLQVIRAYDAMVQNAQESPLELLNLQREHIVLQRKLIQALENPPKPPVEFGQRRIWTAKEDELAIDLRKQGFGLARIGFKLGRGKGSVEHRFKAKLNARMSAQPNKEAISSQNDLFSGK